MATYEPSDDMANEVERQLQLVIAAAALAARKAIAHRQTSLARAQAQSDTRVVELRAQLDRQRGLASSRIQPVFDSAWWEHASPAQVGEMWQETAQWRQPRQGEPPTVFDQAAQRIDQETHDRWRLDINDNAALAHADNVAEHDRLASESAAHTAGNDTSNDLSSAPTERYDTRARRERLKQRMNAAEVPGDAMEARVRADTAQAYPATEAVQQAHGPQDGLRRSAAHTSARQPQRSRQP